MDQDLAGAPDEVHDMLEQLDTEGTVAALEARVEDLEQELARAETRAYEAERGRQGDLEMMRARTQDALELVRVSMEDQRVAFRSFEERLTGLVSSAEEAGRRTVDGLRNDLAPAVQKALLRSDEVGAEVKGELGAVAAETARIAGAVARLAEVQDELADRLEAATRANAEEPEARAAAIAASEERLAQRLATAEEASRYRLLEERGRVEALRRELDSAVGELRAGINLKAGELVERIEDHRLELAERADDHDRAVVDLEERLAAETVRHGAELEPVHRSADELRTRLESVEAKVADTVGGLAGSLTNRVSEVAGRLEALRETAVRHQEQLSGLDQLERRIGELEARRSEPAAGTRPALERLDALGQELDALRGHERSMLDRLEGLERHLAELTMRLPGSGDGLEAADGLRHEIRDLASRTSELATRLEETDRIARTAGQAITRAIRHTRQADPNASLPPVPPLPGGDEPLFRER